jgi:hypothetical protein
MLQQADTLEVIGKQDLSYCDPFRGPVGCPCLPRWSQGLVIVETDMNMNENENQNHDRENVDAVVFIYAVDESATEIAALLKDGWVCYGSRDGVFFTHPNFMNEQAMKERIESLGINVGVYDVAYMEWSLMHERKWAAVYNFRTALLCFGGHSAFPDVDAFERYDRMMLCGECQSPEERERKADSRAEEVGS